MRQVTLLVAAIVLAAAHVASAASIGINIRAGSNGALDPGDSTGPVVAQTNWNNVEYDAGSETDLDDHNGDDTTLDLTLTGPDKFYWTAVHTNPTETLYHHYHRTDGNGTTVTATFNQIPYAQYDVYVMATANQPNRTANVSDGTTTYYFKTDTDWDSYQLVDATTTGDREVGNYFVFAGQTASSFTVTLTQEGSADMGLAAFQIVEVPEPASAAIVLTGLAALLARRRR